MFLRVPFTDPLLHQLTGRSGVFAFITSGQGQLRVHVTAVVTRGVGKLAVATLWATNVVDGLERQMRSALALTALGVALDGKHD